MIRFSLHQIENLKAMDSISELEFKVQILARCMGSALGLGRPTRIEIHYYTPHRSKDQLAEDRSASPSSLLHLNG